MRSELSAALISGITSAIVTGAMIAVAYNTLLPDARQMQADIQALADNPTAFDEACRDSGYSMAIAYDTRTPWAARVVCVEHNRGIGLVGITGNGETYGDTNIYGYSTGMGGGTYESSAIVFVPTRFGGPTNTAIGENITSLVPSGCQIIGYGNAWFEVYGTGAIMTTAQPIIACDSDLYMVDSRGNERRLAQRPQVHVECLAPSSPPSATTGRRGTSFICNFCVMYIPFLKLPLVKLPMASIPLPLRRPP